MRLPGHPGHHRAKEREFWVEVATRKLCRVRPPRRWGWRRLWGSDGFRHAGGMRLYSWPSPSSRYLSFVEQEEIAILNALGKGVREIAALLGRSPSTISRELRRNAATRGGKRGYRASVAQWKAELYARRPKTAKPVANQGSRE
jgi:Helix-turn-helix domain